MLFTLASIALFFDTLENAHDFEVMWKTAKHLIAGETLYSLERDGGMVFKYPPWWSLPFLPFAFFPLSFAKALWGMIGIASLYSIFRLLLRLGFSFFSISFSMFFFWGIWAVHFIDGQVEVPVLALFLLIVEQLKKSPGNSFLTACLTFLMSIKIFSVFSVIGALKRKGFYQAAFATLLLTTVTTAGIALQTGDGISIFQKWMGMAQSGEAHLTGKTVGRDNQGIPAAIRRGASLIQDSMPDEQRVAVLVLILGLSLFAWLFSGMDVVKGSFFWLAGSVILHPLAWFHLFVWTLPLVVWVVEQAYRKKAHILWIFFPVLVGAFTEKTIGRAGFWFEFYSLKSLVVLIALLWFSKYKERRTAG